MALDVYLQSFRKGVPGGGDAAGALALLRAFGARLDDLGAWQLELGDGTGAEVTGMENLRQQKRSRRIPALSCLVRLSELTPRAADFLFGLAQSGTMAVIVPHQDAPGGAYVLLPMQVDPADLPAEALFDAPEGIDTSDELYAVLARLQDRHWGTDSPGHAPPQLQVTAGFLARFIGWLRG